MSRCWQVNGFAELCSENVGHEIAIMARRANHLQIVQGKAFL